MKRFSHPFREVDHRTVRNDDTFRKTRRARRKDHICWIDIQHTASQGIEKLFILPGGKSLLFCHKRADLFQIFQLSALCFRYQKTHRTHLSEYALHSAAGHVNVYRYIVIA